MKILYYFAEEESYMYQWQRIHIFDELERNGHSMVVFNPLNYDSIDQANASLIDLLIKGDAIFDLFMNCVGSSLLYAYTVEKIKSIGLPTLLICFDNLHIPYKHKKIAASFDLVWLTSMETIDMFKNWGCQNIIFQPYASNPYRFIPHWGEVINALCFIGTPYGGRINRLNKLTESGILSKVYTNNVSDDMTKPMANEKLGFGKLIKETLNAMSFEIGRKMFYGALKNKYWIKNNATLKENDFLELLPSPSFIEMQNIYSNSALSLNITELRNTYVMNNPVHKIHMRTFEIPMCGGLEIASYTDELSEYFEDNKEIILCRTDEEYFSKGKFYLNPKNESLILKMKKNARKRAESDHTWMNRFNKVFKRLK